MALIQLNSIVNIQVNSTIIISLMMVNYTPILYLVKSRLLLPSTIRSEYFRNREALMSGLK